MGLTNVWGTLWQRFRALDGGCRLTIKVQQPEDARWESFQLRAPGPQRVHLS